MPNPTMPRIGGSFTLEQIEKIAYLTAGDEVPAQLVDVELPPEYQPAADPNQGDGSDQAPGGDAPSSGGTGEGTPPGDGQ